VAFNTSPNSVHIFTACNNDHSQRKWVKL